MKKSKTLLIALIFILLFVCSSCANAKIEMTLDANGGSFEGGKNTYVIKTDGVLTTLPDDPVREDFVFMGWYLDKEGNKSAEELLAKEITATITLYAKWGYAITFNSNGGSEVASIISVSGAQISEPDDPEKSGNVFLGWFTDDGTFEDEFTFETMPQQNKTLYAKWGYMITFNSNGGSDVSNIIKEAGESITEPTAPIKAGYTFDGWYIDNNTFENKFTFSTMPEESFTLYANWTEYLYTRINTSGELTVDGEYILFGEYPQTIKTNDVTITETIDSRGYYLGSDGDCYAKVTATPFNSNYTFSTGTTVSSGTVYYFKVEPIKWRILEENDDTALILCESIIANMRYDDDSNNYEESEIRAWLNDEFYNTAFTDLQQELIEITEVDNSAESTGYSSNNYACDNTDDKIFLPSYIELVNTSYGFNSDSNNEDIARRRFTSDYSRAIGAQMHADTYQGNWWLRSSPSSSYGTLVRYVNSRGNTHSYSSNVTGSYNGVVPALRIRLS